ncbi:MAG: Glu-tRNA(Gln) amidotransferase subunit GatE [Candidatus Bathyarchaeia archaeon]
MENDYAQMGLKVGIEIHQQLNTKHKLFCQCPTTTVEEGKFKFTRKLRPAQSELGQIDQAALFETQKGKTIVYEASEHSVCLVEMDEEPPHPVNPEAVDTALEVALMLNATPVNEIHVMRKIVVDGSNTGGFQRTCILALGGAVDAEGKTIPIQTICLEEDAARKLTEDAENAYYGLDRLGIPLIEIATGPAISSPAEAELTARTLGRILRGTRKVKRGIGTIRQDLNISTAKGALIEVKGVQKLEHIAKVVDSEVQRQGQLIEILEELKKRGATERDVQNAPVDVTSVFTATTSKLLRKALDQGGVVMAVKLGKFSGLLKRELTLNIRLGTEMADRARFWGGVGGIFHTDEMPAYGITATEVDALRKTLNLAAEDAAAFVADRQEKAEAALNAVRDRALEALRGVPAETRAATAEGTTRYMRPRPGAARMYPETDMPPVGVTSTHIAALREKLPPLPEEQVRRLMDQYAINRKLAEQLLDSDYLPLYEKTAAQTRVASTFIASALTETLRSLEREGVTVEELSDEVVLMIFRLIDEGKMGKEMFPEVVAWVAKHKSTPEEALAKLGIKMLTAAELETLVNKVVADEAIVEEDPQRAFDQIMKKIMSQVRGKVDTKLLLDLIRRKLSERKN